ncbi:hypothetical protein HPP92_021328 [Vanilla planifolia]|uniref:LOB domain-containing protein n=1 Tax=Vanilla planifolia TaxID=51239 RepID=A0A835UHB2_VANPL|nr:hypothetical protein HPP92_021660 [Vanilla planifolia]KAG0462852.1 hypothetical protein HPP92_021328 [Vanilla planifolia]
MATQPPQSSAVDVGKAACAACKKQRKRCDEKCKLAKLFTAEQGGDFEAVHRVFGIKNLLAMLDMVEGEERKRAAREAIVWEARQRLADPVNGSFGQMARLQEQLLKVCEENGMLRRQIKQMHFFMENASGDQRTAFRGST